jgi:DNA polymerase-3 subunit epsilon
VLPGFAEFAHGCVFVAHNASFDFSFLNVALLRLDYAPLPAPPVCTARLARRVVWPDVPNVRLRTLAQYFRTAARPSHRALPDAEACAEVLVGLLDLGERLGISTLGELHAAVRARGRPHYGKIRLADGLPAAAGVYLFRGRDGGVLYVGKSKDLRSRVKSYFYGDERKKVDDLLAETVSVEGVPCDSELESLVLEARLIRHHEPRYNRRGKTWRRYAYLKLDPSEAFPRLRVVREPKGEAAYLGPFPSSSHARLAKEALEDAIPIRRCTKPMRATTRFAACALAEMGRCLAPCEGRTDPERYGELVRSILSSLSRPGGLLEALEGRMRTSPSRSGSRSRARARPHPALAEALERARRDRWLLARASSVSATAPGRRSACATARSCAPATRSRSHAASARACRRGRRRQGLHGSPSDPPRARGRPTNGARRRRRRTPSPPRAPARQRARRRTAPTRRLDWARWSPRSSSRAPARRSAGSSAPSPSSPRSSLER